MVDASGLRNFKGNRLLSRDLSVREPRLFLRRNLEQVLDAHERSLSALSNGTPYEVMVSNERRAAGWDYPTKEMLEDLVKGDKPVLRLDRLQFRLQRKNGGGAAAHKWQQSADEDVELDWLPSLRDDLHLPCTVSVVVRDAPNSAKQPVFSEKRPAKLIKRTNGQEAELCQFIDAELKQPFEIQLDSLLVEKHSGNIGPNQWKRTITTPYTLEVTVHCQNSEHATQLLAHLDRTESSHSTALPSNESSVRATWSQLPTCPDVNELLELSRITGHRRCNMKFGMAISIGWTSARETLLERYNQARHYKHPQQLPTPSSSDDAEEVTAKQYVVRYIYHFGLEQRAHTVDGLGCMLCSSATREGRAELYESKSALLTSATKVNRLMLHYMMYHSYFEWTLAGSPTETDDKVLVSIIFEARERQARAGANGRHQEEYSWIAPRRPFNLSAYVNGDDLWTGGSDVRREGRGGRVRKPREQESAADPQWQPPPRAADPASVQTLPDRQRARISPPAVQNVTFYHSSSKHPIHPDELVSESEDDVHDDRLLHSQRHALQKEHGLTDGAREFHEAFNRHVDVEQSASQKLIWEGVVRFAREHRGQPRSAEWIVEYQAKLKLLQNHGIIGTEVVAYCLGEARPAEIKQVDSSADERRKDDSLAASDVQSTSAPTPTHRVKGKFAKRKAPDYPESPQEPSGEPQKKKNKKHKWSGGGADKDIIAQGQSKLSGADVGSSLSPARKQRAPESAPGAELETPPPQDRSARRSIPKFKFDEINGLYRVDEHGNHIPRPPAPKASTPGTERRAERAESSINGSGKHEDATMMIAHRPFQCLRLDDAKGASTQQGYVFLKDALTGKSAEVVEVEDLDFGKFQSFLKRSLGFKQDEEDVICDGNRDHRSAILDEHSWHAALNDPLAARIVTGIAFAICAKGEYPPFGKTKEPRAGDLRQKPQKACSPSSRESHNHKRVCYCGMPAEGGRNCIACENVQCVRQNFHLGCVGLDRRAVGWQCRECTVSAA